MLARSPSAYVIHRRPMTTIDVAHCQLSRCANDAVSRDTISDDRPGSDNGAIPNRDPFEDNTMTPDKDILTDCYGIVGGWLSVHSTFNADWMKIRIVNAGSAADQRSLADLDRFRTKDGCVGNTHILGNRQNGLPPHGKTHFRCATDNISGKSGINTNISANGNVRVRFNM